MRFQRLDSVERIINLVQEIGFLPFFANSIQGFSVEENCPPELWFAPDRDGPWEWKGPIARSGKCVYGKFFRGKAGFVSTKWLPHFANLRRDGYDFDVRYDDGLAARKDKEVYDTVADRGALLSKELKALCGYRKGSGTRFDTVITRLQMQTYLVIADFVYMRDRYGKPYGWGVAKYSTPEALLGRELVTGAYRFEPAQSGEQIIAHLKKLLPDAVEAQIGKLIR